MLTTLYRNLLERNARRVYKPAVLSHFFNKVDSPMELNWMTVTAIIVIVVLVGFMIMRRRT